MAAAVMVAQVLAQIFAAVTAVTMTTVVLVQGGSHDGGDGSSDPTMLMAIAMAMVALWSW